MIFFFKIFLNNVFFVEKINQINKTSCRTAANNANIFNLIKYLHTVYYTLIDDHIVATTSARNIGHVECCLHNSKFKLK